MNRYEFVLSTARDIRGFEAELAVREVESLVPAGETAREDGRIVLSTDSTVARESLRDLTFFEAIRTPATTVTPRQAYLNRLPKASPENATTLDSLSETAPNAREHGYLTHDFHSYKGKYYPHLVNSCINAYGNDPEFVLDPFMGSGTTNLEAYLRGTDSAGIDLNPIACLISKTKIEALEADAERVDEQLGSAADRIAHRLNHPELRERQGLDTFTDSRGHRLDLDVERLTDVLPSYNREYLQSWFDDDTLREVCAILDAINDVESPVVADILRISLSNIIRRVSLQNDSQLRVNRLDSPPRDVDVLEDYLSEIEARRDAVRRYDRFGEELDLGGGTHTIVQGDSRDLGRELSLDPESVSYVLTSPPYATGLPYIDMQRLSIFLLDLLDKNGRRDLEWQMVGNREITKGQREALEAEFLRGDHSLPESVADVVDEIYQRNLDADVGFRRRNKASLIYKYFRDMERIVDELFDLLVPGGRFTFVVGTNTTRAGDEQVHIFNDELLLDVARADGFEFLDRVEMTHQRAHRAHAKNKIDREAIVTVEKPA